MRPPSIAKLQSLVDAFNRDNPVGTQGVLSKDNGQAVITKIKHEAYVMQGHSAVAHFTGVSGCYAIDRFMRDPKGVNFEASSGPVLDSFPRPAGEAAAQWPPMLKMILVNAGEPYAGWILYQHPHTNNWCTFRKATDLDRDELSQAMSKAHHEG